MKTTLIITIITAVLAIAAGVAIAGLPSSTPGADVVVLQAPMVETRPVPTVAPATVAPLPTTTTSTVAPAVTTTTTTVAATTTTTAPDSSAPDTTDGLADELRERDEIVVAAANATDRSGVATAHAEELEEIGYVDVTPVDAEASPTSAVYYQPGFELEAARMAVDLGWDPLALGPMADMPALITDRTFELVALVGLDES